MKLISESCGIYLAIVFIHYSVSVHSIRLPDKSEVLSDTSRSSESGASPRVLPCPVETDIAPCVCSYEADTHYMLMDCSDVQNQAQLEAVFNAPIPVTTFSEFKLLRNTGLTVLGQVFRNVTFEYVTLHNVRLTAITEPSLMGSKYTLRELEISWSDLTWNTIPLLTFGLYPNLQRLYVDHTPEIISFPSLDSMFLTTLEVPHLHISSIPLDAFQYTPNVDYFNAHNNKITELLPGTFEALPFLFHLDLGRNSITRLRSRTIPVTSLTKDVHLTWNGMTEVDEGAFFVQMANGTNFEASVYLNHNQLTTLDAVVWKDLLELIGHLDLQHNPLTCGCDLAWLVLDSDLMAKVHPNSTCNEGTFVYDLDPFVFEQVCLSDYTSIY